MAYCSRVASSRSSLPAATAAPMPAVMPVCDQATVPFAGGTEIAFDSRHVHLDAECQRQQEVGARRRPDSASASAAAATGPAGCTTAWACVSS
ncbi:MAG: hypothetical protein WDN25_26250 [Acetobacteraceae bacterium]